MAKVVFCLPGRIFSNKFLESWTSLLLSCRAFGVEPQTNLAYTNVLHWVRNLCLGGKPGSTPNQKPFNGASYDYIMWIDSDMVFKPEQFMTLLARMNENKKYQILAGIYKLEHGSWSFRYLPGDEKKKLMEKDKPFKVMFAGFGFMLMRRGVFEKLSYPWFFPSIEKGEGGALELMGDDYSFCQRVKKEANIDTWIDPQVRVGHEKSKILT